MPEYLNGLVTGFLLGPVVFLIGLPWGIRVYNIYLDKVLVSKEDK